MAWCTHPNLSITDEEEKDMEMTDMTWPTSDPAMTETQWYSNTQDLLDNEETKKPWEIHQSNETEGEDPAFDGTPSIMFC